MSLNAVLDDDSDFKLTEAMPDNESQVTRLNSERQEALSFLMENLRPRERKVLDELLAAIEEGKPVIRDGRWGKATLEVCLAILQSSRERREVFVSHQVPVDSSALS